MGCQQSKQNVQDHEQDPAHALTIKAGSDAIEVHGTFSPSQVKPKWRHGHPTPMEIRKIRAELFTNESTLVAVSSTATTVDTALSFLSSDCSGDIHFLDPDKRNSLIHAESTDSGNHKKTYHYPAALYEEMKTMKHFVPTNSKLAPHERFHSPRQSQQLDDDSERYSTISGLSQLDLSERSLKGFPKFEALVDTMELSMETFGFASLVDSLSKLEEGEEDCLSSDGDETAVTTAQRGLACPLTSGPATTKRYNKKRFAAGRVPLLELEQAKSSEMLADMKAMALLADIQDKSSSLLLKAEPSILPSTKNCMASSAARSVKYHRSTSEVTSDTMTACSDLGRGWLAG